MHDTPDPNNPKPGDRFVARSTGHTMTVRYVDDDFVFGARDDGLSVAMRRHAFDDHYCPAPPVWPEPPVRWGVQFIDGGVRVGDHTEGWARCVHDADPANRRLIRYVPEVVE
jgi:hypothetical protein